MPTLFGTAGAETDKAIHFNVRQLQTRPGASPYDVSCCSWFPLSQVSKVSRNATGDDWIEVTEWICEKKGLYNELD